MYDYYLEIFIDDKRETLLLSRIIHNTYYEFFNFQSV